MDVERAYLCVTWWSTRGGRELVLFGEKPHHQQHRGGEDEHALMSGGLDVDAARSNEGGSKL